MNRSAAAIAWMCLSLSAAAATPEEDAEEYVALLEDVRMEANETIEELSWKGISDTRVYDVIEDRLLKESPRASRRSSIDRSRIGHYIRGLAYSGNEKYAGTISKFVGERAFGRHARQALEELKLYARWNPIISSRATFDAQYSDDVNRVRNMLRADDRLLQRLGAKCVFFRHASETVLIDLVADRLRASYKTIPDPEAADALAWMVKAIGKSGDKKHVPLLQEVSAGTQELKVSREADGWLRRLQ